MTSRDKKSADRKTEAGETDGLKNRRRDERVSGSAAVFQLRVPSNLCLCKVQNLSRLGLGIELPAHLPDDLLQQFQPDSTVRGTLRLAGHSLELEALVRVRRERFLGIEFVAPSNAFLDELRALLSPQYVASSIYPIAPAMLSPDIEWAFHGDEFECVKFKSGVSGAVQSIQLFAGGRIVEVVGDVARFVPGPLVRTAGTRMGWEFLTEFAIFSDSGTLSEMCIFFQQIDRILQAWPDCPAELRAIVHKQLASAGAGTK